MFHKQQFLVNEKVLLKNQIMKMVWHPNLAENEQSSPQEPMHLMKEEHVFSLLTDYTGQKRDVYSSGQQTEPERLHTHEAWTPTVPKHPLMYHSRSHRDAWLPSKQKEKTPHWDLHTNQQHGHKRRQRPMWHLRACWEF